MEPQVYTCYFNSTPDPQRKNVFWEPNVSKVMPLINSVIEKDCNITVFHDCFINTPKIKRCEWIRVSDNLTGFTSSVLRWFRYKNYLKTLHILPKSLFMVDSTDVIMLNNPFEKLESNKIYCGDEPKKTNHIWLKERAKYFDAPDYQTIITSVSNKNLLNAGICGGKIDICIEFLNLLTNYHFKYNVTAKEQISIDMPVFNYTLRKHFQDRLIHGHPVNTEFKRYKNDMSKWWKHK